MRKYFFVFICFGAFSLNAMSFDLSEARMLSLSCANCHGTGGESTGVIPSINKFSKEALKSILLDFKMGKRKSTVMQQHMKGYTNSQIEQIARYYSKMGE